MKTSYLPFNYFILLHSITFLTFILGHNRLVNKCLAWAVSWDAKCNLCLKTNTPPKLGKSWCIFLHRPNRIREARKRRNQAGVTGKYISSIFSLPYYFWASLQLWHVAENLATKLTVIKHHSREAYMTLFFMCEGLHWAIRSYHTFAVKYTRKANKEARSIYATYEGDPGKKKEYPA